jgi:hypothetical protein
MIIWQKSSKVTLKEEVMEKIITLNKSHIDSEHICCAFSDKKCRESYELKKVVEKGVWQWVCLS